MPMHKCMVYDSYRPVSLKPNVLKAVENVLCGKTVNHWEAKKLSTLQQRDFWHGHSLLTNQNSLLDEITSRMDRDGRVKLCHAYFRKTLDSLDHRISGWKVKVCG